ncbi:MAG: ANTAR domain-containing protein [Pseudomonadota bacterium]|nr:ANTAR domain-containing protein [Pseudomonadota bacterium]
MQLKALLVKDDPERSELLRQSLLDFGHTIVGETTITDDLLRTIEKTDPELLVIDSDSPGDMLLSRLRELALHRPLPVVLFTEEDSRAVISQAVRAGVSAYIVDGLEQHRLGAILDIAVARFNETKRLRQELDDTRANLLERKAVERAKGILMKQRGFDEPQAYHALRKMAMDKNLRIGQVAENVIAVAELLN